MKLNPEDLSVTSFRTSESAAIARPTTWAVRSHGHDVLL